MPAKAQSRSKIRSKPTAERTRWASAVIASVGLAILVLGFFSLFLKNFMWGDDVGYSTQGRLAAATTGLLATAVGATTVQAALKGTVEQKRLAASLLLMITVPAPLVVNLNVGAFDRFYNSTGITALGLSMAIALFLGLPLLLAIIKLRAASKPTQNRY